jgi:hypothetical protein
MSERSDAVAPARIERTILLVRGEKVILDAEIAALYRVPTKALVRAVKRNAERFPSDFMFQLDRKEMAVLRYQFICHLKTIAYECSGTEGRPSLSGLRVH